MKGMVFIFGLKLRIFIYICYICFVICWEWIEFLYVNVDCKMKIDERFVFNKNWNNLDLMCI